MKVHTLNFGDIEVPQDKIVEFKEGLPGFPRIRRVIMLEMEELKPFHCLQSLDDPPIALYVINPFLADPNYKLTLNDSDMADISGKNAAELAVFAVVTIPEVPREATINLMAPIVINDRARCGKQIILHESGYSVRHPLFEGNRGEAEARGA
ncbi:MAG TPA: flagellar assembly protein FliW [Acidobacteriota bacterium]|nr:flagellar assembly protein FliW [Acidobacteriota bacterium]